MNVELIKYCSFGYRCPVAILNIDNAKRVYTIEGVQSLYESNQDESVSVTLKSILTKLEKLKYIEFDEINWDDLSGQSSLF